MTRESNVERIQRYRDRAEACRAEAARTSDPYALRFLVSVAESDEGMVARRSSKRPDGKRAGTAA